MKRTLLVILGALLISVGCSAPITTGVGQRAIPSEPAFVEPLLRVTGSSEGMVNIEMGAANQSPSRIAEQDAFGGRWQLLDEAGELRAEGHIYLFSSMGPEETLLPLHWEGQLEEGTYRLLWGAPSIGSATARFEVEIDGDAVNISYIANEISDSFPPTGGFVN